MLNGIDPVIIFQFSKLAPKLGATIEKIPVLSDFPSLIAMPPVPIYLSQRITGLHIDNEDKNVDIQTTTETTTDGSAPQVDQKGVASVVAVNLLAKKDSIGLSLLSAMIDQIFNKVTSKEYSITYLHGPITVFQGLLHSYAVNQSAEDDIMRIKIEISKGEQAVPTKADPLPKVPVFQGATPIG